MPWWSQLDKYNYKQFSENNLFFEGAYIANENMSSECNLSFLNEGESISNENM